MLKGDFIPELSIYYDHMPSSDYSKLYWRVIHGYIRMSYGMWV